MFKKPSKIETGNPSTIESEKQSRISRVLTSVLVLTLFKGFRPRKTTIIALVFK